METQNTMEEKKTITVEEANEAIKLLRTFAEQHDNSALIVALHSGPNISLCSYGRRGGIAGVLSLYAMKSEAIKNILSDVGAMLKDESKEGEEYRAMLKTVTEGAVWELKILGCEFWKMRNI